MSLLFDEDYEILKAAGLEFIEDEASRYLIILNYPLPHGAYHHNGDSLEKVSVLVVIPQKYNTYGNNMLWVNPPIQRIDGKPIPQTMQYGGGDARHHDGKEYCRWSRHYKAESWTAKVDNITKILGRIEWAFQNPDADR